MDTVVLKNITGKASQKLSWLFRAPHAFRSRTTRTFHVLFFQAGSPPSSKSPAPPVCELNILINGVGLKKFLMGTKSVDLAVIHNDDPVCILDTGNTLCNDQLGGIRDFFCKSSADTCVCGSIYRTGGIIQNQYSWVSSEEHGRYRDAVSDRRKHWYRPAQYKYCICPAFSQ